jgi:hypothetical protein
MKKKPLQALSFITALVSLIASVSAYAYWVVGKTVRNDGNMAIPTTILGILTDAFGASLMPGLALATYAACLHWRGRFDRYGVLFVVLFLSAWFFSAYGVAWTYRVNFGNTWYWTEVLLGLVIYETCTWPLMGLGLLLNVWPYRLWCNAKKSR